MTEYTTPLSPDHPVDMGIPVVLDFIPSTHLMVSEVYKLTYLKASSCDVVIIGLISLLRFHGDLLSDIIMGYPPLILMPLNPVLSDLHSSICAKQKVNWQLRFAAEHEIVWCQACGLMSSGFVGVCYLRQVLGPASLLLWGQCPE